MTPEQAREALERAEKRYVRARHFGDPHQQSQAADELIEARRRVAESRAAWRAVLGFAADEFVTREAVAARFRERAKAAHPDAGGTAADMAALSAARDQALAGEDL